MTALPPGAIGNADTRTLLALIRVRHRDGRATVRTVAKEANRTISVTDVHLLVLDELGLADYGVRGGLRPLVEVAR